MSPRPLHFRSLVLFLAVLTTPSWCWANEPGDSGRDEADRLQNDFAETVVPFVKTHCVSCHGHQRREAGLNLAGDTTVDRAAARFATWRAVRRRMALREMPPAGGHPPPDAARKAVIDVIDRLHVVQTGVGAGEPGIVAARRLNAAEYNYTIFDLTGADIRPARDFPVDPANRNGFANTSESLVMSPALLRKYLAAARRVADHLVFHRDRLEFAHHPVKATTDRDRYCVQRIVQFYQRHTVAYEDYFLAAWRFHHRRQAGEPALSLNDIADRYQLSRKYLSHVWAVLTDPIALGPLGELQSKWRELPDDFRRSDRARRQCIRLAELVRRMRKDLAGTVKAIRVNGMSPGSQPFVLWRNHVVAASRMSYLQGSASDPLTANRRRFCRVFPDRFAVVSRGHYSNPKLGEQVRLLSAGFHLMHGYFRDDQPLCHLVLNEQQQRELNSLWYDLYFVTSAPIRQYKDFVFFERSEPPRFLSGPQFDFARSEDQEVISSEKIHRLRALYLARAKQRQADQTALRAISFYFDRISGQIDWVLKRRDEASAHHLQSLIRLGQRAYRRPFTDRERASLLAFYRQQRDRGLTHQDAIRDTLCSLLVSPHFCYRFTVGSGERQVEPLTSLELASRLSFFLWSSMPDYELFRCAVTGDLTDPQVMRQQARRMLRDEKISRLGKEFLVTMLNVGRFEGRAVDRQRFADFDDGLRRAMLEEPVRYFVDVCRNNRSVWSLIDGRHTFLNVPLARHYQIPPGRGGVDGWFRVDDAAQYGRGGLLPMSVFLTANSPGSRTSPVRRGHWVVRHLLGEEIPAPPADVKDLSLGSGESQRLSVREAMALHRRRADCAGCHRRFDFAGLALQEYGPTGKLRQRDGRGRRVDATFTTAGGSAQGLKGLQEYIRRRRAADFEQNLVRRLFSYALGRSLLPSDEPTLREILAQAKGNDFRFHTLVEMIVTTPQFLTKRGAGR